MLVDLNETLLKLVEEGKATRQFHDVILTGGNPCGLCKNGQTVLGKAVQLGNRDVIYALIREIPDFVNRFSEDFCSVNAVDKYARTPLHYACDKDPNENFIDVICLLLGAGCKLDPCDKEHVTPLHLACGRNNSEAVLCLLRAGASPNVRSDDTYGKVYPLHIAASKGHVSIAELLLDYGADVDAKDNKDQTALYLTVSRREYSTANLLIARKANVNFVQLNGYTPLVEAVCNQDSQMVELLLKSGAIGLPNQYLLHQAIQSGATEIAHHLIRAGFCLSLQSTVGDFPLHIACRIGAVETVKELLVHGADPNSANVFTGSVPLLLSVANLTDVNVFAEILNLMINAGAETDIRTIDGDSLIRRALLSRKPEFVRLLISHGCRFNEFLANDQISMLFGTKFGSEFVEFLISTGCLRLGRQPMSNRLPFVHGSDENERELLKRIKSLVDYYSMNALSLKNYCRISIRSILLEQSQKLHQAIDSLPDVPENLKLFLKLYD